MAEDKFDVIVVGAGPAGSACALTLARAGLTTLLLERGEYPGSKNIFGGVLYTPVLDKLIPNFWQEAPVERHITKRRFSLLSEDSDLSLEFRTETYNKQQPYNNSYSCLRAKFDRWFAQKAEEAGAMLIPETVVDNLIMEDGKVVGVSARREGGQLKADVVVAADGANSFLAREAGLRKPHDHRSMAVAVKEVLELDSKVIEERFNLQDDEGVAMEFFAGAVKGLVGGGFLYTNQDSLSVGLACTVEALMEDGLNANDLLEDFKKHPMISRFIKGAKPVEYSAHMIPEAGYEGIAEVAGDGIVVTGDAAGFVNISLYHEGTNLAMASGVMAAEAIINAKKQNDFSKKSLSVYKEKLEESFVLKDLKKYRKFPDWAAGNPKFFKDYPEILLESLKDFFTISGRPKADIQKDIITNFRKKHSILKTGLDTYRFLKVLLG